MNKIDVVAICIGLICSHTIAYGRGEANGFYNGNECGKKYAKRVMKYQQEETKRKEQTPFYALPSSTANPINAADST